MTAHLKSLNLTSRQRTLIMLPLLLGGFIALLNETILNVAFPELMESLHVSMSTIQWLATGYMLVIGILVPVTAFLLKTFSTKKLYVSAMALFGIGTVCCCLSITFPAFLASRILQAAGTGMMLPIMMDTIMEIFPPEKRGAAMGICMMVVVAAPGVGPVLAGLVLQFLDWHYLFLLILPFAVLSIALGMIFLKKFGVLTKPKIDLPSIALSTIGFGGTIFSICSIEQYGITNPTVLVSLGLGLTGLYIFSQRQLRLKQPMLDLQVFRYPMFTLGAILLFIGFMMPFAVNIILPTYMQSALMISPFTSGIALLPGCILNIVVTPISGRVFDRIGAKPLLLVGFCVLSIAMFFLSRISAATTLIAITLLQATMTIGLSFIFTPVQTNSLNQLPKKYAVHGVAVLNTLQQISAAFGSSLFIGLMGAVQAKHLALLVHPDSGQRQAAIISGTDAAFTAALVLVLVGLALSPSVRSKRREAASIS